MAPWCFAVVCRWRVSAICTIRQAKTCLFIVFPWIKLQEESGYSKAVMVFLCCERFAGKIDVDSSRNRIAIDASAITIKTRTALSSVESWMIGDILSVYGEIKI